MSLVALDVGLAHAHGALPTDSAQTGDPHLRRGPPERGGYGLRAEVLPTGEPRAGEGGTVTRAKQDVCRKCGVHPRVGIGYCATCKRLCSRCGVREKAVACGKARVPWCVECRKAWGRNKSKDPVWQAHLAARELKRRHNKPESYLLNAAKRRAKVQGVPFNITVSDIQIPSHCPVLGVRLCPGSRTDRNKSPSLDRIVPDLGYVPGNVRVISWRANDVKGDATVEELTAVLKYMQGVL